MIAMTTQRSHTRSPKKRTTMIVSAVILLCVAGFAYINFSASRFEKSFGAYDAAERAYEESAFKPGAEENPVRQQVNQLLAQVLQVEMSQGERIEMARQGIAHLDDIEDQIDDVKEKGDVVAPLLASVEKGARSPGNAAKRSDLLEIVKLGKRQAEIIADIRGLSYRADYYTTEIFERVIDDQGLITDDHKTYLNGQIPQLEEQFNKRSNLYRELADNRSKLNELATKLGYTTQ